MFWDSYYCIYRRLGIHTYSCTRSECNQLFSGFKYTADNESRYTRIVVSRAYNSFRPLFFFSRVLRRFSLSLGTPRLLQKRTSVSVRPIPPGCGRSYPVFPSTSRGFNSECAVWTVYTCRFRPSVSLFPS